MTGYFYTEELDRKIKNYCFVNFITVNELFLKCGLSGGTYYQLKRRGIIGLNTARKLDKVLGFVIEELGKQ